MTDQGSKTNRPSSRQVLYVGGALVVAAILAAGFYVWTEVHPSHEASRIAVDFVGKVAWPLAVGVVLLAFRRPIVRLLRDSERVRIEGGGFVMETQRKFSEQESAELADKVDRVVSDADTATAVDSGSADNGGAASLTVGADISADGVVTRLADTNPNMAMMAAFIELEVEARDIWRRLTGHADTVPFIEIMKGIRTLETRKLVRYLWEVRNGIAHGTAPEYTPSEALAYQDRCQKASQALRVDGNWSPRIRSW